MRSLALLEVLSRGKLSWKGPRVIVGGLLANTQKKIWELNVITDVAGYILQPWTTRKYSFVTLKSHTSVWCITVSHSTKNIFVPLESSIPVATSFFVGWSRAFKENVMYPVLISRDLISLILGTRFSLMLGTRWTFLLILGIRCSILGNRFGSLKHLQNPGLINPKQKFKPPKLK